MHGVDGSDRDVHTANTSSNIFGWSDLMEICPGQRHARYIRSHLLLEAWLPSADNGHRLAGRISKHMPLPQWINTAKAQVTAVLFTLLAMHLSPLEHSQTLKP